MAVGVMATAELRTAGNYLWPTHEVPPSQRRHARAHGRQHELSVAAPSPPPPAGGSLPNTAPPLAPPPDRDAPIEQAVAAESTAAVSTAASRRRVPAVAALARPVSKPERPRPRGSLSEQLAVISGQFDKTISGIKQSVSKDGGEMGTPLLLVYCNRMTVGRAESQFSAAVSFYQDKVVYAFQHAREKRIDMIMFYKDMRNVSTDDRKATLSFRINKPLEHFSKDYDHTNPVHLLTIPFSRPDFAGVKAKALPLIHALAR